MQPGIGGVRQTCDGHGCDGCLLSAMAKRRSNTRGIRIPGLRTALAIALLLLATPLVAQNSMNPVKKASDTSALARGAAAPPVRARVPLDRSWQSSAVPAWTNASAVTPAGADRAATVYALRSGSTWENTTTMIVGGAGILAGTVVSGKTGSLISIGGIVVGLIGFLNYVR